MNMMVNPELAAALARITELEAELAYGDAADKINNAYTDGIEEALEELEVELVGERAKALTARAEAEKLREELAEESQIRADAEREVEDLKKECEGLVEERDEANKQADEETGKVPEALGAVADLLRDYLLAHYRDARSLPAELRKVCDEVSLDW